MSVQVNGDFEALSPLTLTCPSSSGLFRLCCPLSSHRKIIVVSVCGSRCSCLASGNRTQTKRSNFWKCVKMNNSYLFSAKLSSRLVCFLYCSKHIWSLYHCVRISHIFKNFTGDNWIIAGLQYKKYCSLPWKFRRWKKKCF